MGALTIAVKKHDHTESGQIIVADVTWSSSYATGGDTYTLNQLGLVRGVDSGDGTANNGMTYVVDGVNNKIKLFTTYATEATAATNQSAVTARVTFYADNPYI